MGAGWMRHDVTILFGAWAGGETAAQQDLIFGFAFATRYMHPELQDKPPWKDPCPLGQGIIWFWLFCFKRFLIKSRCIVRLEAVKSLDLFFSKLQPFSTVYFVVSAGPQPSSSSAAVGSHQTSVTWWFVHEKKRVGGKHGPTYGGIWCEWIV